MMKDLDLLYLEVPTRGTRLMTRELKKKGCNVGRQHVRSLMQIMRLKTVYCRPRTTIAEPGKYKYPYLLCNLEIRKPNHVWSMDTTYVPMGRGYMYLLAIMDVYSKCILGWSLSNTMDAEWVVEVLRNTILRNGKPEILNSDQGSQFTSEEYVNFVKSLETVRISMDGKGKALDNVYIERFFRTIKYEKIYLENPETGKELHAACSQFIHYYNERRDHSSIGDVPPMLAYRTAA